VRSGQAPLRLAGPAPFVLALVVRAPQRRDRGRGESGKNRGGCARHPAGKRNTAGRLRLPTKVVTDCAASEAEKRPTVSEMAVPPASLELEVVTYGVTEAGQAVPGSFAKQNEPPAARYSPRVRVRRSRLAMLWLVAVPIAACTHATSGVAGRVVGRAFEGGRTSFPGVQAIVELSNSTAGVCSVGAFHVAWRSGLFNAFGGSVTCKRRATTLPPHGSARVSCQVSSTESTFTENNSRVVDIESHCDGSL
jgi:hypothetical protein